ncbi:hypothetical protein Bpfe_020225, partial [Biomphalaria pfeifferi]
NKSLEAPLERETQARTASEVAGADPLSLVKAHSDLLEENLIDAYTHTHNETEVYEFKSR